MMMFKLSDRTAAVLATLVIGVLFASGAAPSIAWGQEAPKAELERKEPGVLMGERAYRRFDALVELYTTSKYSEALKAAQEFVSGDLNNYERAMGEQIYGYALIALDRVDEAVPHFEKTIELNALPNNAHFSMMRALAQLYSSREEWQKSIDLMMEYFRYQPEQRPEDQIMMAQNYAQMERYREALPWVRSAISSAGAKAVESWHQLELAIHFELKDYRSALNVLKVLVAMAPQKLNYWEMLAGVHQELNQDADALAALMAAYNGGLIVEDKKILNLVRMSMYVELPYQAGQILTKAMEAGRVQADEKNLRLLLQAWTAAREYNRAGGVIDRLGPMTGEGDLFMQKARLMMEQNEWQQTVDAARQALEVGNLSNPGGVWLMLGIGEMELGELSEARQAFQKAQEFDPKIRAQAREWERFVADRIQVANLRN